MDYRTKKKIRENENIKNRINMIMAISPTMLVTSTGLLTVGAITSNPYMIVGSMVGAVAGIGATIRNYNLYNYDRVVSSPLGPDDGVWTIKSLKEQYEDADKEIENLKRHK